MASSLEFYFRRVLPTMDSLREFREKLFGRSETLSATELYDRFVQSLFSYGMQVCRNREVVKEALLQLFVQIKNRGDRFYVARPMQIFLFTQFRKILNQVISASGEPPSREGHRTQTFEPLVPQAIRELTTLQHEAIFLRLTCEFNNREVAVIMDVKIKTVSQLIDEGMEYLRRQQKLKGKNSNREKNV